MVYVCVFITTIIIISSVITIDAIITTVIIVFIIMSLNSYIIFILLADIGFCVRGISVFLDTLLSF